MVVCHKLTNFLFPLIAGPFPYKTEHRCPFLQPASERSAGADTEEWWVAGG